jgi:mRNA interferase MazF
VAAPLLRLRIEPSDDNGLRTPSELMIDKLTTVSRVRLHRRVGRLAPEDIVRLNRAVIVFLGLAGSPSSRDSD